MQKTTATLSLLILLLALVALHLLVMSGIIPYDQVWGGRLHSEKEMLQFELVALFITLFMLTVVLLHYRNLKKGSSSKLIRILLWIVFGYFLLNTLGNLAAESIWESVLGTAVSLTAAGLAYWAIKGRSIKGLNKQKKLQEGN